METWLVVAVICGAIGFLLGRGVERPGLGAIFGFLFGPLGLILILLLGLAGGERRTAPRRKVSGPVRVPCPMCKEMIIKGAAICPHCRSELTWPEVRRKVVKVGGRVVRQRRLVVKPRS